MSAGRGDSGATPAIDLDEILALSDAVRYVAVYDDGGLETRSKPGTADASSSESDRYEELLVNPTLLKLTGQRGDIDCGGLDYVLIRYGHFFQYVQPTASGHLSVCIDRDADPIAAAERIRRLVDA